MLPMDMPYAPPQETPIVLVAADTSVAGATPQPDYIFTGCKETPSAGDTTTAMNGVNPAGWLALELSHSSKRDIINNSTALGSIKLTLLEGTSHGELVPHTSESGILYYMYAPIPKYEGDDRAVFMVEFEGKRYRIVVNLIVKKTVDENTPLCPQPQLIKVNGKPVSGSGYSFGTLSVAFTDLNNAAGFVGAGHAREQNDGRGHGPLLQGAIIYPRLY